MVGEVTKIKPPTLPKIGRRAVQAGARKFKKSHHIPSEEEVLGLRIQVATPTLRLGFALIGVLMILSAYFNWFDWPNWVLSIEVVAALSSIAFSIFGVKTTLENLFDRMGIDAATEVGGVILEQIIDGISNVF